MEKFERKTVKFETKSKPVAAESEIHFGFDPSEGTGNRDLSGTMSPEEYKKYLFNLLIG